MSHPDHKDPLVAAVMRAAGAAPPGDCPDVEVLGLYAERALSPAEHTLVETHVAGCHRCQSMLAAFVLSDPDVAASGDAVNPAAAPWWAGWRWLVPVASLAAVAVVAVWIGQGPSNDVAEQARAAAAPPAEIEAPITREAVPGAPAAPAGSREAAPGAAPEARAAERAMAAPDARAKADTAGRSATFSAPAGTGRPDAAAANEASRRASANASPTPAPTPEQAEALSRTTIAERLETRAKTASAERSASDTRQMADAAAATGVSAQARAAEAERKQEYAPVPATPGAAPVAAAPAPAPLPPARATPPPPPSAATMPAPAQVAGAAAGSGAAAGAVAAPRAADAVDAARPAKAADAAKEMAMPALTGTVTYRARVALPPGAVIEVRLLDVSRADAPATTMARSAIVTTGEQVPVPFTLRYDPAAIQPRRRYTIQATITIDGRVAWRTTSQHQVLADGAATAPVAIVVDAVR